jgi:hypothetical protein
MVEHLLIGFLGTVFVHGTKVLHLNAVHIPDPLIHAVFEFLHGREIGRDGVRCPDIRCSDPVKWQPSGFDYIQHLQAVFAV